MIDRILALFDENGCMPGDNSVLELASLSLEAKVAGLDISPLAAVWEAHKKSCGLSGGRYRRSPTDLRANSHDNWTGIAVCSYLFDGGQTARECLSSLHHGLIWITSFHVDGEWIVKPENKRVMQFAAGTSSPWPVNKLNDKALDINLRKSTVWNMKRVRLLLMYQVLRNETPAMRDAVKFMGTKYRGRYEADVNNPTLPVYTALWELNEGAYYVRK